MNRSGSSTAVFWAAIFTVVIWGSAFPGIRYALATYSPMHMLVLRFSTASLFFLALALAGKIRRPSWADGPALMGSGILGIALYQLFLCFGQRQVSAGVSSMIVNSAPIWTAVLAGPILHEHLSRRQWMGVSLGFLGALCLVFGGTGTLRFGSGAFLVLLASVSHGGSFLVQKPLLSRYRPVELIAYTIWSGTLFFLPFFPGLREAVQLAPMAATATVIYLGIAPAALAYASWAYVLSRLPVSRAVSFLYLVPVSSLVIAWFALGERPSALSLAGGAMALGGVALVQLRQAPLTPAEDAAA